MKPSRLALALALASACAPPELAPPSPTSEPVDGDAVPSGWRAPAGPCQLDPPDPSRLVLTTTDFVTGAVTVVNLRDGAVEADVAVGSDDAVPFADDGRVILVHRFNNDRIDVLDPNDWALVAQHGLPSDAPSANPQGIAIGPDGRAYVPLLGEPSVRVLDLDRPAATAEDGPIDLSGFADDDGNPEASLVVTCGDLVLVTAQRLGPGFVPRGPDVLIAIDPARAAALDLEPATAPPDPLPLMSEWVRQLRRDPSDPRGLTLLALSRGIERIELRTGRRRWAVDPADFAAAGIDGRLLPQAFDVDDRGTHAYLAAYDPDFSQVRLYRVGLDGAEPAVPEPFADGMDSVERSLELVGDQLWYGSTRATAPGLWRFDVSTSPPALVDGPLPTGLPPYSMVVLP